MADLLEKQFELDGVVFGMDCPVDITPDGFRPGGTTLRASDADLPTEDGRRFGVTLHGGETWGFGLFTNLDEEVDAWNAYTALKKVWSADKYRRMSGEYTRLRYRLGGQTRNVYGQPRRWTPGSTATSISGMLPIECDFETADDQVYDDDVQSVTIRMGSPLAQESGFLVPMIPPFTSTPRNLDSTDEVVVDSDEDTRTWVTVILTADASTLSQAEVTVGDWTVLLRDPVPPKNAAIIDPRPWVRTATLTSGGGVAINPRVTRMAKMWLPPGRWPVIFNGVDPTNTASCTVSWQNARRAPR